MNLDSMDDYQAENTIFQVETRVGTEYESRMNINC